MFKVLVCLSMMVVATWAGEVKFADCGSHNIKKLLVTNCSGEKCDITRGEKFTVEADFTANVNSKKATIVIEASVNGAKVQVPGVDTNACNYIKCPVVKGKEYDLKYAMTVPKALPAVKNVKITAKLVGDNKEVIACGTVHGDVK